VLASRLRGRLPELEGSLATRVYAIADPRQVADPTYLHSLWDSGLLSRMGTEDALYTELDKDLTPKRAKKFAKGKLDQWADQSHRQAQVEVYGRLPKAPAGTTIELGETYQQPAVPIVREQLERAGARLAKILNATLK